MFLAYGVVESGNLLPEQPSPAASLCVCVGAHAVKNMLQVVLDIKIQKYIISASNSLH
jgi:hypothetical protein